jgi:hypothetical protein
MLREMMLLGESVSAAVARIASRHLVVTVLRNPFGPICPPGTGVFLCIVQPRIGIVDNPRIRPVPVLGFLAGRRECA